MNLLKNIKISVIHRGDTALANTDVESTALVDMSGWDGVLLVTGLSETTAGATTTSVVLAPRHASATTGPTSLGTTARAGGSVSTGDWGKAWAVDIYRPLKRYIGAHILKSGAGTSLVGPVYAIQYAGMKAPVTQVAAQVKDSKQCISPTT